MRSFSLLSIQKQFKNSEKAKEKKKSPIKSTPRNIYERCQELLTNYQIDIVRSLDQDIAIDIIELLEGPFLVAMELLEGNQNAFDEDGRR